MSDKWWEQAPLAKQGGDDKWWASAPLANQKGPTPVLVGPAVSAEGIDWNMPEADIKAAIRALPEKARKSAMDEWARQRVTTERKQSAGVGQTIRDVGRNLVRGTPVGSFLDEGMAAGRAAMGGNYDEELALERARNKAVDDESTKLGTLPVIGDVTAGGLTKLAGGILSAPLAPVARIFQGATLLPRMANAGISGAGYGAVYGAGEGQGAADRALEAGKGALVGGAIGVAAPAVASGVANTIGGVQRAFTPMPQDLRGYSRGAVNRVTRAAVDDNLAGGPAGAQNFQREAARLGPEGMLADMGDNLRGQAGAIANAPGRGQTTIRNALNDRRDQAQARITTDVNAALGDPVNVPRTVDGLRTQANQQAAPLYQQFYQTPVRVSEELQGILDAAREVGAYDRARRLMIADRVNPNLPENNGQFLDYIKRAVDDLATAAPPRSNEQRIFGNLARSLRSEVDAILSPNDPAMSVWAQARRIAGDGLQFEEAAEMGQSAFARNLSPDQMGIDLQAMNPLQQEAYRVGARDNVRSIMGNAATSFGPNGDTAARSRLQSQFATEKLRMVAQDPAQAQRLTDRLRTESDFATTDNAVMGNSATAGRQAAQREFPGPTDRAAVGRELGQRSLSGLALEGGYRVANLLTAGALNERRARIAENAARMLVAQGVRRDQIAAALDQYVRTRRLNRQQIEAISNFGQRLIEGGRSQAVSSVTSE